MLRILVQMTLFSLISATARQPGAVLAVIYRDQAPSFGHSPKTMSLFPPPKSKPTRLKVNCGGASQSLILHTILCPFRSPK
ncbi:hypothetical protein V8F20_002787 [Naviculisporaceae sp. PSN 640]